MSTRADAPLVSVILTTRERPRLLAMALACYQHQTYGPRELIVVDDGMFHPANVEAVDAVGGLLIYMDPDTPLGSKLNRGLEEARGALCLKMDDDDWYAPRFLETMVSAVQAGRRVVCGPKLAYLTPFLLFDLARWEVRRISEARLNGAALLFAREDWREQPFRPLPNMVDTAFRHDQLQVGTEALPVAAPDLFLSVRHEWVRERGHTWTHWGDGRMVETAMREHPLYPGGPEALLPNWALAFYRSLRRETDLPALFLARHAGTAPEVRDRPRQRQSSALIHAYMISCAERETLRGETIGRYRETDLCDTPLTVIQDTEAIEACGFQVRHKERRLKMAARLALETALRDGARYMLFLEDDLDFNLYTRQNLTRWPPFVHDDITLASLYNPGIAERRRGPTFFIAEPMTVYGSQALLISRSCVQFMLDHWDEQEGGPDIKFARLVARRDKPIYYHTPSLVQHVGVQSTWGGTVHDARDFDKHFRAEAVPKPKAWYRPRSRGRSGTTP